MNCSSSEARFERFLDGDLTPAQSTALQTHLDACADCRGVLEELRVVDALLIAPRRIELAPNFTFATLAEVRAMPPPRRRGAPLGAYLVCYLAAAWLLAGAGFLLAPDVMHALGGTLLGLAAGVADAFGGVSHVVARSLSRDGGSLTTLVGGVLLTDVTLAVVLGAALAYVRPRVVERLRS